MFDFTHVKKAFAALGVPARCEVEESVIRLRGRAALFDVDIERRRRGRGYVVRVAAGSGITIQVLDVQPRLRHLMLLVVVDSGVRRGSGSTQSFTRYLCGHDERDWFVAPIPGRPVASTVLQAFEALKPGIVRGSVLQHHVKRKDRNRRRNAAFVRQGEWFFVPAPAFDPGRLVSHHHEPLRRGRSKPHIAEWLVRTGGVIVKVNRYHSRGLTPGQYAERLHNAPHTMDGPWWMMTRDPIAHVRGTVRHSDHATVTLDGWHRVVPNREDQAPGWESLTFLD